jgi:hypothetical protein
MKTIFLLLLILTVVVVQANQMIATWQFQLYEKFNITMSKQEILDMLNVPVWWLHVRFCFLLFTLVVFPLNSIFMCALTCYTCIKSWCNGMCVLVCVNHLLASNSELIVYLVGEIIGIALWFYCYHTTYPCILVYTSLTYNVLLFLYVYKKPYIHKTRQE